MVLKFTGLVVGIAIVGKRRAAPADRIAQESKNRRRDRADLLAAQPVRARGRFDTRQRENLVGVNVAESGDDLLIEQKIANAPFRRAGKTKQIRAVEPGIEGIEPDMTQLRQLAQALFFRHQR